MKKNTQNGFSLVELLLVVTIIGIIAAIGIPSLQKGIKSAENTATYANLRVMSSTQLMHFTQNNRFARLSELNTMQNGGFGATTPTGLTKGRFTYEMTPLAPTDAELKDGYTIIATGRSESASVPYVFRLTQTGEIVQVTP